MPVHAEAARQEIEQRVAKPLGLDLESAAEGILRIAAANMSRAIRAVALARGGSRGGMRHPDRDCAAGTGHHVRARHPAQRHLVRLRA
ncbi:hypothetical protein G6F68_020199 [Rhizopus microsporus]|nr:hypothetical protein G6F68_020199 [Rhizopus microsporus]